VELLHAVGEVHGQGTVPALGDDQKNAQQECADKTPGCGMQCGGLEDALEGVEGVHGFKSWIPAFAGMTNISSG
jgi:hypothetical protein